MDTRNFTFLAYGLITAWAVLMVYVIYLARRGQRLERDLKKVVELTRDRQ